MNEQIKELAEQAGMTKMNRRSDGRYVIDENAFEKFAELVVRECGNYMNSRIPGNLEVSATVAKMKQHFGGAEV